MVIMSKCDMSDGVCEYFIVFYCVLLPSGVINDDDDDKYRFTLLILATAISDLNSHKYTINRRNERRITSGRCLQ